MAEWITSLDTTVQVALVGILSAVVSALVGGWVSSQTTSKKFELEMEKYRTERRHSLGEEYLSRARERADDVYIPLSSTLARLKSVFKRYRYSGQTDVDLARFDQEIDTFISELERLERLGASAFMTTELEERLLSFVNFLRASKSSDKVEMKSFIDYSFSQSFTQTSGRKEFAGKMAKALAPLGRTTLTIPGISIELSQTDLTRAPLSSEEFQARFERDTYLVSVLVKEVMLGVPARRLSTGS